MLRHDHDLGSRFIPYAEGRALQQRIHDEVVAGTRGNTLILLEHEPVYTVGRRARSWERPDGAWVDPGHVPVVKVDRGGKTTWHGPGQLTVYPIVALDSPIDVIAYVRALEAAVMEVCEGYGVSTMRVPERSGVWVSAHGSVPVSGKNVPTATHTPGAACPEGKEREKKICALGVRISRGVTLHGIGFNIDPDLAAFGLDRIIPCGIDDAGVTSLAQQIGRPVATQEPADAVAAALSAHLSPLVRTI